MELDRIDPVTLITGAATGVGGFCAPALAKRAEGGLILVDSDESALDAAADALIEPPERVSTLAFDAADPERWTQATRFIRDHYGRLDWAVISVGAPQRDGDLVRWGRDEGLDAAAIALRALLPLLQANANGGAVILAAATATLNDSGLLEMVRVAAAQAPSGVRVNAITSGPGAQAWRSAPLFGDLVHEHGDTRAAFGAIARLPTPLARYAATEDQSRLVALLLSDANAVTGATLVVDGGYAI